MRIIHRLATVLGASALGLAAVPAAHATYGINPSTYTFGTTGQQSAVGGGHPDVTFGFEMNRKDPDADAALPDPTSQTFGPDGTTRALDAVLPTGLVANPTVISQCSSGGVKNASCPANSAAGEVELSLYQPPYDPSPGTPGNVSPYPGFGLEKTGLYRVEASGDEVAAFGAELFGFPFRIGVTVGPDGGYRVTASAKNINEIQPLLRVRVTLWGIPADHQGPPDPDSGSFQPYGGPLAGAPRRAFTALPSTCGSPLSLSVAVRSWQSSTYAPALSAQGPTLGDCDQQPFDPTIAVTPSNTNAGAPSGYRVDLNVPQPWTSEDAPAGQAPTAATAHLKDVRVALPTGVAISPSAANGLGACSDDELAVSSSAEETCPDSSKIGTVQLESPVLDAPVDGTIYLGTQQSQDPASGDMYRIFLTATGPGVKVKLRGSIKADPVTGQLTTTFADNPQLPFSKLTLNFKDGDRAPLVNPTTCGTKTAAANITSWAGQARDVSSSFDITGNCPTGQFAPGFTAGTLSPLAGGLSPFTTTISRTDADQDLKDVRLDLPSGLLGALGKVPVCADAQAAAGTCGPESRLGSTQVDVGTGGLPFGLGGTVSLAGPYKGAPFSLSIAVPAKAGPLDLGLVVVRSPLIVDANNARVSAPVDDLPQIVGGVPLHYRQLNVTLDRPGFMFNATNCGVQQVSGTFTSTGGALATPAVPYQAQGCDKLKLAPSLKIAYSGKGLLQKGKNPKLTADLGQTFGQAGLKQVKVVLPLVTSLQASNAKALCKPEQAAAKACPDASIVGRASATTPALHQSLTGPVYFVEGTRTTAAGKVVRTTPKLYLKLRGDGVDLDLHADSSVSSKEQLTTTFTNIPDAPIENFHLEIDGGKNGILAAVDDPCTADRKAQVQFDGQNGGRQIRNVTISADGCGVRASMNANATRVKFGVSGIGAGKVVLSGAGLVTTTKTITKATSATITAKLTAATRSTIAAGHTVKLRLTAGFTAKGSKKATKVTKTVTIKGASRATRR